MKRTLRLDLSLRIGVVILLISFSIAVAYFVVATQKYETEFKSNIQQQTHNFAKVFTLQLWLFDLNTTSELCQIFSESPDIAGIELQDHNQEYIFQNTANIKGLNNLTTIEQELFHTDGKRVGHLKIFYKNARWEEYRKDILLISLFIVLATSLTSFVIINLLLLRHLSNPLDQLQKSMTQVAQGSFQTSALQNQKAEIQNIINAFNNMAISLKERDAELFEANKIVNRSPAVAFVWKNNTDLPVTFVSENVFQLTGYKAEEFLNKQISYSDIIHRDDIDRVQKELNFALENEESFTFTHDPYQIITKEGSLKWVRDQSFLRKSENGGQPFIEGIVFDITHEVFLQERLQQAQKMESIGTLAGGIAHDFNNILGAILGYTELSIDDAPTDSNVKEYLSQVLKATHRAKDLVRQILDFSRQSEAELKPVILQVQVKEALKILRPTIPSSIEITTRFHAAEGIALADPTQFQQILINLCTNAVQAMENQTGSMDVELNPVHVQQNAPSEMKDLKPGKYLCLTVKDTGVGIPANLLKRIFDPYFTTKDTGKGTGMGLAIIHGIMQASGGGIHVESEPGKGSSFYVYFPEIEQIDEEETQYQIEIPGGTESILYVDDEVLLTNMMERILTSLGYQIIICNDSVKALELFTQNPEKFDAVITDQTMPNLTGLNLSTELLKIRPDLPIILCSGYSEQIDENIIRETGIATFTWKPVTKETIARLLRQVFDGNQEQRLTP